MKITYNPKLKELARKLRNNSTRLEIRLWRYLRGKEMMGYDFHRQKPIENFIVDFFCNKLKLAIELDGCTHGFEEVVERDKSKEERLNQLGISILRFKDEEVMNNVEAVLRKIQYFIEKFKGKEKNTHPLIPSF